MPTISVTVSADTAADFTQLAKERGFDTGKDFLVALARTQLAHWRATKKQAELAENEFNALEGEVS